MIKCNGSAFSSYLFILVISLSNSLVLCRNNSCDHGKRAVEVLPRCVLHCCGTEVIVESTKSPAARQGEPSDLNTRTFCSRAGSSSSQPTGPPILRCTATGWPSLIPFPCHNGVLPTTPNQLTLRLFPCPTVVNCSHTREHVSSAGILA
jgi:hypothetical protein